MPLLIECRCRQRFSAADHLIGTVVACPACGSPISVVAPPAGSPFAAPPNPHGTATQQFRRNPFWFFLHGVEIAEHQAGQASAGARFGRKLALIGLALTVLFLALATFLIATVRFGPLLGVVMAGMGLGVAFVPLVFGFYFLAAALYESQLLMMSRRGRGVRYLFGDQGARWFFIAVACPALLIGLGIQLFILAGTILGRDPDRNRNVPVQVADDRPQHVPIDAAQAAANDRARKQMIEDFRRENADLFQNPEVAAEFEKKLRERFPDRK